MKKINFGLILLLSFFTCSICAEELGLLSPEQLIAMQKNTNALVIDIRTEKEWETTGIIPDSHKLQFFSSKGKYDEKQWLTSLKKLKTSNDQPVILVCRSGNRSEMVGNLLSNKLNMKNIYHLSEGIMPWIEAGNKTSKDCLTEIACK